MQIRKSIQTPEWNEKVRQQVISFWQERRVVFAEPQSDTLKGKRGTIWGNLTSYDMSKLMCTLTVSRTNSTEIVCILDVNTFMQGITEWNKAYWQLELDTLESWLLQGDKREAEWQAFLRGVRKAAIQWTFSGGRSERKMPPKL